MKISSVREFRDNATALFRSKDPVLVTRRGRIAGVFFPSPEESLPIEFKRELFSTLTEQIKRRLDAQSVTEEDVAGDFAEWQKQRREARRRR
jgi:hypothetical protein